MQRVARALERGKWALEWDGRTMPLSKLYSEICDFFTQVYRSHTMLYHRQHALSLAKIGSLLFQWYKVMCRRAHPFNAAEWLKDPPAWWRTRYTDDQRDAMELQVLATMFNKSQTALDVSAHLSFEHSFDIMLDELIPFEHARRATGECADHFFVYLYYLVPILAHRSLTGFANARSTWQVILEAQALLVPTPTDALAAKVAANKSYS